MNVALKPEQFKVLTGFSKVNDLQVPQRCNKLPNLQKERFLKQLK